MPVASDDEVAGTRIRSVERACRLLLLLATDPDGCTAAEAARSLELTVPTTHHLLNTLADVGLAAKDSRRRYALGPRVAVLADGLLRQGVPEYLAAPLRRLAADTGESAYLAAWGDGEIRTLASVEGANALRVAEVQIGPYRHAHARATGKLLLAHARDAVRSAYLAAHPLEPVTARTTTDRAALEAELAAIRAQGYSEDREEFIEGVCCLSAPLLVDGVVAAAYTVSAPAQRFDRDRDALLAAVMAAPRAAAAATSTDRRPA